MDLGRVEAVFIDFLGLIKAMFENILENVVISLRDFNGICEFGKKHDDKSYISEIYMEDITSLWGRCLTGGGVKIFYEESKACVKSDRKEGNVS